nr:hypothetical protein Iba_chr14bCG13070 [Ipomoea batatas]
MSNERDATIARRCKEYAENGRLTSEENGGRNPDSSLLCLATASSHRRLPLRLVEKKERGRRRLRVTIGWRARCKGKFGEILGRDFDALSLSTHTIEHKKTFASL